MGWIALGCVLLAVEGLIFFNLKRMSEYHYSEAIESVKKSLDEEGPMDYSQSYQPESD